MTYIVLKAPLHSNQPTNHWCPAYSQHANAVWQYTRSATKVSLYTPSCTVHAVVYIENRSICTRRRVHSNSQLYMVFSSLSLVPLWYNTLKIGDVIGI